MARKSAAEVSSEIMGLIESGEWAVDSRVPAERLLAERFGAARNTVRSAIGLLERDGAIRRENGRTALVADRVENGLAETIRRIRGVSPNDMMEVRSLVEPAAAAAAAVNAGDEALRKVAEAHRAMTETRDHATFELLDAAFHEHIFAGTKNDLLREIHNILLHLRDQPVWSQMKRRVFSEERRRLYCDQHGAILDALTARAPQAASEAMAEHIASVKESMS